jgi:N-acetylglucosaminyldiphosphoundecaprenol N-acetyl-beta-D-mannosaminyltransferase
VNLLQAAGFIEVELFAEAGGQKAAPLAGKNICFRAIKPCRIEMLGVPFDMPAFSEALAKLHAFADAERQTFVTTPNPEICVAARRMPAYAGILKTADFSVADGIGILWAGEYLHSPQRSLLASIIRFALAKRSRFFPTRVSGADLFRDFCHTSKQPIFLLGGAPGVAETCAEIFRQKGALIAGTDSGKASADDEGRIVQKIDRSGATVLFVAFGAPKQELWISRNLSKMPNIRLAMGIGGSFDFVAGTQKRAPSVLRTLGLEWLWRLIREPSRRRRIFTALFTFPQLVREEKRRITNVELINKPKEKNFTEYFSCF